MAEELRPLREPAALPSAPPSTGLLRFKGHQAHSGRGSMTWPMTSEHSGDLDPTQSLQMHRAHFQKIGSLPHGTSPVNSTHIFLRVVGYFEMLTCSCLIVFPFSCYFLPFLFCIQVGSRLCLYWPEEGHGRLKAAISCLCFWLLFLKSPTAVQRGYLGRNLTEAGFLKWSTSCLLYLLDCGEVPIVRESSVDQWPGVSKV